MKLRRLGLIVICVAFLPVVVGVAAVNHLIKTNPTVARKVNGPMPVQVVAAEERHLTEILGANGEVQPIALVSLTAKMAVPVDKVSVDLGDIVAPGQVLIQFDRELPRVALATAKAAVEQAAAARDRAVRQFRRVKTSYEQGLSSAVLAAAQAALDQTADDVARVVQHAQRIQAIYEQKLLPKAELEKAQAAVEAAAARHKEAKEKLLRVKKDLQLEAEKAQTVAEEAHARYQQVQEKLVRAKRDLKDSSLVSPVAGIVLERFVNAGETPRPNQPLLTIGQIDHVLVEAKITEDRVSDVHLKQAAIVTFSAFPNDEFEGEVVKIKPASDPKTKTFLVYVKVTNPEGRLKPGLSGFVRIKRAHSVLALPSIALISPTGVQESSVFVVENGLHARLRRVKIGVVAEGMTQILDGLTPGDRVVVVGQLYLRDGDQVRIGDEFDEIKARFARESQPPSM